jgi:LAS superfamily LD-carboxypeptidase LdcB
MKPTSNLALYIASFVALVGVATSAYLLIENRNQKATLGSILQDRNIFLQENNNKKVELTTASSTISELEAELAKVHEELEELADDYRDEKDKNGEFEDQLRKLAGTVGDLDKLSKTDEELLQKYSKVYFLNENYIPDKLSKISDKYLLAGKEVAFFHGRALDFLEDMLEAAAEDGIDLKVVSAYRSFDEQSALKGQYTQVYGSGANAFSADQGYSEHQLGTTLDLTVPSVGGAYTSFAQTAAYTWLLDNAHKYGFILSYPENNAFYIFEPWHWRFVGTDLARDLHIDKKSFYELDQREINDYLLNIFD